MRIERISLYPVNQVGEAITLRVQVGRVYLVDISREHNLGVVSSTCDDRFHLVRRQILRLIHNKENVAQATPTDVGQRRDHQFLLLHHLRDLLKLLIRLLVLILNELQVVPQWLHIGIQLAFDVSWQEPNILVRKRYDGAGQKNLLKVAALLQGRS